MNQYLYSGPVMEFGRCIAHKWKATTTANSEKKAKANLAYRFKTDMGKLPNAKITLPGKIFLIEEEAHA